ncbi:lipase secretion chaperone [Agitococcus lubricus]|uniref:Lipase chaperone n=1 Tax=Agitococcus lubricus TaxID=1077255 RepID=A0A2T5J1P0_9GAMM|nr:lipase secretion chaperone [Agitococcus lubricus]PTQ90362.1 lipase chaperone LimK [Agitococcus lubricus]
MKPKVAIAATALLLISAGGFLWLARDTAPESSSVAKQQMSLSPEQTAAVVADAIAKSKTDTRFKTGVENMPRSLQDTEVDGALSVDNAGNLIISRSIRQTFDYFLSAIGEEDLTTIVSRIRAYIRNKLADYPKAMAQAEQILDGYLSYREALGHIAQIGGNPADNISGVRQQKEQIASLRTQYLSREVIEAFFGDEDAYDRYTMARIEIMQDKNLSATEKAKRAAELLNTLPPELKESVETLNKYQELTSLTDDWKARGGKPEELRAIREQLVGVEATERLEALDQERAAWDGRMNDYLSQRDTILKNQALSQQDRERQVNDLKQKNFNQQERIRVDALETMHDQGIKP